LKFESLKNDFEKSFKKEKTFLFFFSPSPLSLLFQPAQFSSPSLFSFSPQTSPSRRPFPVRALAAHASPTRFPAGPNRASSFSFNDRG
jgi:hypothetical protein